MRLFVRLLRTLVPGLSMMIGAVPATADAPASPLVGLWEAKKRFGPDIRGMLTLVHRGPDWRGGIAGREGLAKADGDMVTFTLPGDAGSFRGRLEAGGRRIRGHWIQPGSVTSGMRYATPVTLTAQGLGLWRGAVEPLDDRFTLYLKISREPDGRLGAFLRNPDRNIGRNVDLRHIEIEGNKLTLLGRPGGMDHEVPVAGGTYNAEDRILSIYIGGRGGTYDFEPAGGLSDFYPRPGQSGPYLYRPPLPRDDGWAVSTLEAEHIDQAQIQHFVQMLIDQPIEDVHSPEIHGVLIARHGKLVLEEYFHGVDGNALHDTRSAAKSLTSVLIGAAMQAGVPIDPSTPVYATMEGKPGPDLDPRKRAMTLEHLLTMSSGFHCDDRDPKAPGNEDVMQNQEAQPDWYRYALDLPMAAAPGDMAVYCSTNPNLAGGLLSRVMREPLEDAFDRLVARPMQFGRYALDLQPTGEPYMGGGAQFLPRDFMKLGQLMLDGGVWQGHRILGADWVRRSTAPAHQLRGLHYGYLWWGIDLPWRGRTLPAFYAAGNGGQVVMVVPALDLVVAIFGGNYGDKVMYVSQEKYTPDYILPAVRPEEEGK